MGFLAIGRKNDEELILDVSGPCRIRIKPWACQKGRCRIATNAPRELVVISRAELMALTAPVEEGEQT